jgi:hypothetical protein
MIAFLFLAFYAVSVDDFSLRTIIAIEKLENGTDAERLSELEKAFLILDQHKFTPTPDDFRIVAQGLAHENDKIRAVSAALLERFASRAAGNVASDLVGKRNEKLKRAAWDLEYDVDDETWFKCAYYLVRHPEIPDLDAYQAFKKHFQFVRCGYDGKDYYYKYYRKDFKLESYLQTKDLSTLQYAMKRQIEMLEFHRLEVGDVKDRLENIAMHCPDQETRELAKSLYAIIDQQTGDR